MNFLGPDDTCPNCGHTDVPAQNGDLAGTASYACPGCDHRWTTAWNTESRPDPRVREHQLLDPSRFAEADDSGRYVYDDPDDGDPW